ncbi:MAG: response regulator [Ignavibacteriae bacterium]|nr:response regulator [Ignavibacteriota bacterium]
MDLIRILLIEDDIVDQLAFKRHVEREKLPYRFDAVKSLAEAKRIIAAETLDVIVSDYNLGDGTAIDACEISKGVPLIIITGAGNEEIAIKALKSGAYDYIIKDPERNYLKVLPLTVQKAANSCRADRQMKMLLHAIMHISDSVYITNVDGTIRFANASFCRTYQYTSEEILGRPSSIIGDDHADGEYLHHRKDGAEFFVSLSKSIIRDSDGDVNAVVTVARDITEHKRAEEALRSSEEKYRKFFDEDLAGAFVCTPDGKLVSCNPSFARIFGFDSADEALSYNFIALFPKSRQFTEIKDLLRLNGKLEHHEIQLRRRDGSPVFVIQNIIGKMDASGRLIEIRGYIFDNTRHKLLEEQLRQAQKMESIGTLAGGIAHDFNNILGIILGHVHILYKGDPAMVQKANSIDSISRAVQRGAKLVKQILTFARRNEVVFESININALVEELKKMLAETFPKMIEFSLKLDPALPTTVADANQVHQALLNLCVNARDAMPNGGKLLMETELVRGIFLRERYPDAHEHLYACLRVQDTGEGMPPDVLNRMFEPFFTTKDIGRGTGLGLAVVYGVIKSHKGFVEVSSQIGQGTTFTMYFPIREAEKEDMKTMENDLAGESAAGGTILVVEDEPMLLELVQGLLEAQGYKVLSAVDGLEAVELYARHKDEIGLVLTDLGLPKLDGWEVFQRMKEINPKAKVIIASGYVDPALRQNLLNAGARDLVQKPYMPQEILTRVRQTIEEDAAVMN